MSGFLVQREPAQAKITIPDGVKPGNTITVNLPDGRSVKVTVPRGMKPGNVLTVNYTIIKQPPAMFATTSADDGDDEEKGAEAETLAVSANLPSNVHERLFRIEDLAAHTAEGKMQTWFRAYRELSSRPEVEIEGLDGTFQMFICPNDGGGVHHFSSSPFHLVGRRPDNSELPAEILAGKELHVTKIMHEGTAIPCSLKHQVELIGGASDGNGRIYFAFKNIVTTHKDCSVASNPVYTSEEITRFWAAIYETVSSRPEVEIEGQEGKFTLFVVPKNGGGVHHFSENAFTLAGKRTDGTDLPADPFKHGGYITITNVSHGDTSIDCNLRHKIAVIGGRSDGSGRVYFGLENLSATLAGDSKDIDGMTIYTHEQQLSTWARIYTEISSRPEVEIEGAEGRFTLFISPQGGVHHFSDTAFQVVGRSTDSSELPVDPFKHGATLTITKIIHGEKEFDVKLSQKIAAIGGLSDGSGRAYFAFENL